MDATQYLIQVQEMPEDSHSQPDPIKTDMSTPQNSDKNVLKYKLSADFHEEVYEDKKYPKLEPKRKRYLRILTAPTSKILSTSK